MSPRFAEVADRLRAELAALNAEKETAAAAGDSATVAALAVRISAIERELDTLQERVRALGTQSIRFDIRRNADGFMSEIIATPLT